MTSDLDFAQIAAPSPIRRGSAPGFGLGAAALVFFPLPFADQAFKRVFLTGRKVFKFGDLACDGAALDFGCGQQPAALPGQRGELVCHALLGGDLRVE